MKVPIDVAGRLYGSKEKQRQMIRQAMINAEKYPERLIHDEAVEIWVNSLGSNKELPLPYSQARDTK